MSAPPTAIGLLNAYAAGYFPMADSAQATDVLWYDPPHRALLPIANMHIPRRLRRSVRAGLYEVRVNTNFAAVMTGCAARESTWINPLIRALFIELHAHGFTHSVECYKDGELVGGVYGLAIGGLFCGESMFSRARDASKIALVHLTARLWAAGFTVFDAQFDNPHLHQFGMTTVPRAEYHALLNTALPLPVQFGGPVDEGDLVRRYLAQNPP